MEIVLLTMNGSSVDAHPLVFDPAGSFIFSGRTQVTASVLKKYVTTGFFVTTNTTDLRKYLDSIGMNTTPVHDFKQQYPHRVYLAILNLLIFNSTANFNLSIARQSGVITCSTLNDIFKALYANIPRTSL